MDVCYRLFLEQKWDHLKMHEKVLRFVAQSQESKPWQWMRMFSKKTTMSLEKKIPILVQSRWEGATRRQRVGQSAEGGNCYLQ